MNEDEEYLRNYEKIGSRIIKYDGYASKAFDLSIMLFFFFFYIAIIVGFEPATPDETALLDLSVYVLFFPGLISLVVSAIIMVGRNYYEWRKKYDAGRVVKLLFYELSKKPGEDRKINILKHISYVIWKIRPVHYRRGYLFFSPPSIGNYLKNQKDSTKIVWEIIDQTLDLVNKSLLYWNTKFNRDFYQKIGDCFGNKDFHGLFTINTQFKDTYSDYDIIKSEMKSRAARNKLWSIGIWIKTNAKEIMYVLFIFAFVLYLFGWISTPVQLPI